MADDLNRKLRAELDEMKAEIRRLQRANPLEAASVTNGQIRIIGGTIRVDGGGNLIVNGTMSVNGTSTVTGSFTVSGPWNLQGNGTISGAVTISGNVTATGTLTQNGPWNLNGAGTIAGNVTQTGNTTQQGNVTLTGGGKVTAGNVTVEPNKITIGGGAVNATLENGELTLSNGAKLAVGLTGGSSSIGLIPGGSADISVNTLTAWLRATGSTISVTTAQASISAPNIYMANMPAGAPAGAKAVSWDPATGKLYHAA